jgi:HEPN domain-containing protein
MSERPELLKEVARWTEKAEHDFLAAEHAMELAQEGLTDTVCFHCQQCAEKYLKALLLYRAVVFPRTHDLRLLLDLGCLALFQWQRIILISYVKIPFEINQSLKEFLPDVGVPQTI